MERKMELPEKIATYYDCSMGMAYRVIEVLYERGWTREKIVETAEWLVVTRK